MTVSGVVHASPPVILQFRLPDDFNIVNVFDFIRLFLSAFLFLFVSYRVVIIFTFLNNLII